MAPASPRDVARTARPQNPSAPPHLVRGFTLIEVLITVFIIALLSAIALPSMRDGLRDRRTRQTAEEIARVFRDARLRAIGRGSAVVVHYTAATRRFEIREAVLGPPSGTSSGSVPCARIPSTTCQGTNWVSANTPETTPFVSQSLENYFYEQTTSGVQVVLERPDSPGVEVGEFSVCYTPMGRTFAVAGAPVFTPGSQMTYVPHFRVYRTVSSNRIGLERRVVLLPNGQARLQTAPAT